MRWVIAPLAALVVVASCGGKVDAPSDAGDAAPDAPPTSGFCCPPDPSPNCCMHFGGFSESGTCAEACDGMPVPSAPGWHQVTDSHGCSTWIAPTSGPICGAPLPPPDAGVACAPADVSGFVPSPVHPYFDHAGVCSSQQLSDYYAACFSSSANAQQCNAFTTQNQACVSCMMTSRTSATWGTLLADPSSPIVDLDIAGCVAIVSGDSSSTSCAQKLDDVAQCESAACAANCPVTDGASFQAYTQCVQAADAGGCAKFVSAECSWDAGALATCEVTDFQAGYQTFAPLFCGN